MTLAEAIRQYQIALEHRRTVDWFFDGTWSAAEELDQAYEDVAQAKRRMEIAWMSHIEAYDSSSTPTS